MAEAEEMVVARVDAKLAVGASEVLLEKMTASAFVADDVQECVQPWKAEFERLVEVGFRRYVTIDGMPGRVA